MHAWICIDRSSRPPNAPPTPPSDSRTRSGARPRLSATWSRSTCSHCVAMCSSTPPAPSGTARPDSGPRNAWSCIPTSYSPVTTTGAAASGSPWRIATRRRTLPPSCSGGASGRIAASASVERLQHVVLDPDRVGGVARGLGMVGGDDRDRLALEADVAPREHRLVGVLEPVRLAPGHVGVGEHGVHAGHRGGGARVERADPRARVRAAQRRAPQHPLDVHVRRVRELAEHLRDAVDALRAGADPAGDLAAAARRRARSCRLALQPLGRELRRRR